MFPRRKQGRLHHRNPPNSKGTFHPAKPYNIDREIDKTIVIKRR
jgi:hypothetical protein